MKQHFYFNLFLAIVFCVGLQAQQDPHISLYRFHLNMFNPAVVGSQERPTVGMTFRSQWQGFEGAPETQVVSFATPTRGERVGLGFHVINDRTFVERQTQVFNSFSYRLPLNDTWTLFLGLQAGFNAYRVNAAGLTLYGRDKNDPNLIDYSHLNPNVGVGAYLKHDNFYLSLSAPRVLNSKRLKDTEGLVTTAADRVQFYGSAAVRIPLTRRWDFVPSFLARYVQYAPLLNTVNASFSYDKTIDFGVEYNFQSGMGATLMVDTFKTFSIGYAYVTSMHTELNQFSNGNHEVAIRIYLNGKKESEKTDEVKNLDETEKPAR